MESTPPERFGHVAEIMAQLESAERECADIFRKRHFDVVALWNEGLALVIESMRVPWDLTELKTDSNRAEAKFLQSQLVGVGISSAKAGIDRLTSAYYNTAFAAIRHTIELAMQIGYLESHSEQFRKWRDEHQTPPSMRRIVGSLKSLSIKQAKSSGESSRDNERFLDDTYKCWELMCTGVHPSGEGLASTYTINPNKFAFGPHYVAEHALAGSSCGLFGVSLLLPFAITTHHPPLPAAWKDRADDWIGRVNIRCRNQPAAE